MSLIDRVLKKVGLREAIILPASGQIDADDDLFTPISGRSRRDLTPVQLERARAISHHLWRSNPMAHRLVEMMIDFTVGADGLAIQAEDEAVQELLDGFWHDRRAKLHIRHKDFERDLLLNGELCLRRFVNDVSGRARLGYIDVRRIKDVELDEDDLLIDTAVLLKPVDAITVGQDERLEVVNWDDVADPAAPKLVGDTFYRAINRVTGQHRGIPDLYVLADYVDGYDQVVFNALERSALINAFIYDVELKGVEQTGIDEWKKRNRTPPPPGSVNVHNDAESWNVMAPNLGNADIVTLARETKNVALGGIGIPEAWFAQGDSANRATLAAQGDPTYRMLSARQESTKQFWLDVFEVVIQDAIEHGQLKRTVDRTVAISAPDPSEKDTTALANTLSTLAAGLQVAEDQEYISRDSARKVFLTVASQIGVELDPTVEEETIGEEQTVKDAERAQQQLDDVARLNAQFGQAGAPNDPNQPEPRPALHAPVHRGSTVDPLAIGPNPL